MELRNKTGNRNGIEKEIHPSVARLMWNDKFLHSAISQYNRARLKYHLKNEEKIITLLENRLLKLTKEANPEEKGTCFGNTNIEGLASRIDDYTCKLSGSKEEKVQKLEDMLYCVKESFRAYVTEDIDVKIDEVGLLNKKKILPLYAAACGITGWLTGIAGIYSVLHPTLIAICGTALAGLATFFAFAKYIEAQQDKSTLGKYWWDLKRIEIIDEIPESDIIRYSLQSIVAHELGHAIFASYIPIRDKRNRKYFHFHANLLDEAFALYVEQDYNNLKFRRGKMLYLFPLLYNRKLRLLTAQSSLELPKAAILEEYFDKGNRGRAFSIGYAVCGFIDKSLRCRGTTLLNEICKSNYDPFIDFIKEGVKK